MTDALVRKLNYIATVRDAADVIERMVGGYSTRERKERAATLRELADALRAGEVDGRRLMITLPE